MYDRLYLTDIVENVEKNMNWGMERRMIQEALGYIEKHSLIVYGGFSLHLLLISQGHQGLYSKYALPDIDFYSPNAFKDWGELCKSFYGNRNVYKGYVTGKEAVHSGTYTIQLKETRLLDITYCPLNIFNKIPTTTVDYEGYKIRVAGIEFVVSQNYLMRMKLIQMTDIIKKHYTRSVLIEEYFPEIFNPSGTKVRSAELNQGTMQRFTKHLVEGNKDVVLLGEFALKYALSLLRSGSSKEGPVINSSSFVIYMKDSSKMEGYIEKVKKQFPDADVSRYNSFMEIFPYQHTRVSLNGANLATVFACDQLCIRYKQVGKYSIGSIDSFRYWWYSWKLYSIVFNNAEVQYCNHMIKCITYIADSVKSGKMKSYSGEEINCKYEDIKDDRMKRKRRSRRIIVYSTKRSIDPPKEGDIDGSKILSKN